MPAMETSASTTAGRSPEAKPLQAAQAASGTLSEAQQMGLGGREHPINMCPPWHWMSALEPAGIWGPLWHWEQRGSPLWVVELWVQGGRGLYCSSLGDATRPAALALSWSHQHHPHRPFLPPAVPTTGSPPLGSSH